MWGRVKEVCCSASCVEIKRKWTSLGKQCHPLVNAMRYDIIGSGSGISKKNAGFSGKSHSYERGYIESTAVASRPTRS
jgi:hypothetical protein